MGNKDNRRKGTKRARKNKALHMWEVRKKRQRCGENDVNNATTSATIPIAPATSIRNNINVTNVKNNPTTTTSQNIQELESVSSGEIGQNQDVPSFNENINNHANMSTSDDTKILSGTCDKPCDNKSPPSIDDCLEDQYDHSYLIIPDDQADNEGDAKEILIEGRRIVDIQYIFNQMFEISMHSLKFNCQLNHLKIVKEVRHGLSSHFKMHCSMCRSDFQLNTSQNDAAFDVNHAAVAGIIMIGCGLSNFNELATTMGLPTLNPVQYKTCHDDLHEWWKESAEVTMKDAAEEEAEMATEKSSTGKPMIPVTADACWSKRSYRTNYSALSGVGAIIGVNSGKVLHIGVKNKYCVICMRAKNKDPEQEVPKHKCNINHKGSSTSMEQAAIVEGFKKSENVHNLVYSKLIADGDASTYKKILDSRPYNTVTVEKIECSNHLLRNYNGKNIALNKDTSIPREERKLLTADRVNRLRIAVKAAVRFRKAENLPTGELIKKLQKDIANSPLHIFGDHSSCEGYYCKNEKKLEPNYVPYIPVLLKKLTGNASSLAFHAKSLLHKLNNNRAEQFNSLVAKYTGGKRINYALNNSYALRCYAAVVAFNTGTPITTLYKKVTSKSPSLAVKRFEMRKRKLNSGKKTWKVKRRIDFISENADYGEICQKPDMTPEEYETAKIEYVDNLKKELIDRECIERDTRQQADSALWLELRRSLVTASNFGKICKRRQISSAPLVKTLLYSYSIDHVPAIAHGKSNEATALFQLAKQENITLKKCGLYIDQEYYFLGATPDSTFENGIVEIKCPLSGVGLSPDEGIQTKKINFWKIDKKGNVKMDTNHNWYYQVQGQLHITKQDICLFAVWTGPNFPLKTEIIKRDDNFWETKMRNRLVDFYFKCMLPEIVDPRKCRSMELRNCTY